MAYPLVNISNSTNYNVTGEVKYKSFLCSNDDYSAAANKNWTAQHRGVCLVTEITAIVETPSGNIAALSYTSSGTSYSQFAVVQTSATTYQVTRLVGAMEDQIPSDYVEPTTNQKG